MNSALIALAVCAVAAALEGAAAGTGVRAHLASLRLPWWALPFGAWVVVGGLYYVLCFVVLYRLLERPSSQLTVAALATTVLLMGANAAFNAVFFRRRNLYASFLFFIPYAALAIALFILLLFIDPVASAAVGLYLVYLIYATAWGYQVWRLNGNQSETNVRQG